MDERSLDKALEIYSRLISGSEVSEKNKDSKELYEAFYGNGEVYDIVMRLLKKLGLRLYEYNDSIFITAGEGNKVFGYTNDELKKLIGLRLNKELYLVYFIMYCSLLYFYKDSSTYQTRDYIRLEDIVQATGERLIGITGGRNVFEEDDESLESFKAVMLLWDNLPLMLSEDSERNKASRGSKTGFVKLTFNFLINEKLFVENSDRYYPTDRFRALAENYFEDFKGKIYTLTGGAENAGDKQDQG
ncbi:hypothetical protein SAMN04487934_103142 [Eubacterium ruminantium]|nr:hypothetical protein SAMN04487934_103142 [Eubacterium ruminantium]